MGIIGLLKSIVPINSSKHYKKISVHFDREYYLSRYPDVRNSGIDPVRHYIEHGHLELRNPSAEFDTAFYLAQNPDVAESSINPFLHFIEHGRGEGRESLPVRHMRSIESDEVAVPAQPLLAEAFDQLATLDVDSRMGIDPATLTLRATASIDYGALLSAALMSTLKVERNVTHGADAALADRMIAASEGKLLSLDIWDTLLRRRAHPDEVKLRSARSIWLRHARRSPGHAKLHPVDIFQLRRLCENHVADEHFEYRLSDAAASIQKLFNIPEKNLVDEIQETELRIEKDTSYPDPTLAYVLAAHKGRKIAVSDFYLKGEDLAELLRANGIDSVDHVYASCDTLKTKREGSLFEIVLEKEGLAASDIVHIGDRMDADVERPRARGLDAIHFHSEADVLRTGELEKTFWQHVNGDSSGHCEKLLNLAGCEGRRTLPLSAMAIPLVGFVLHILEEAVRLGVEKTFFCTREGVFFRKVYDALVQQDVYDLGQYPESAVLEVSRRATFAASMEDFSTPELMRLWSQYSSQSLVALATTLNIDPAAWAGPARAQAIDFNETLTYPWTLKSVQRFLARSDVKGPARKSLWDQRSQLLKYLEAAGFDPAQVKPRLLVDIGWRGTIQDNLARVIAGPIHGCYFGLDRYLNPQIDRSTKSAFVMNANDAAGIRIAEYAGLEFLFNSVGGSVIGYQDGKAIREIIPNEEALIEGKVAGFQQQLLAAAQPLISYIKDHGLVGSDLQELSRAIVSEYCRNPPEEIVTAFFELEHNESFGVGSTWTMSQGHPELEISAGIDGAEFHGAMRHLLGDVRWHSAFLKTDQMRQFIEASTASQLVNFPVYDGTPAIVRKNALGVSTIAILAPQPIKGSGGHRTIYNMAKALARAGHEVHLMHERLGDTEAQTWASSVLAGEHIIEHDCWYAGLNPTAAIATIWYSPYFIDEYWRGRSKSFYFIQDFEASFNPVGDVYLRAQRSYAITDHHICIGRWLPHLLRNEFGLGAASAGLGVDHRVYRERSNIDRQRKIAFLFQPEKFRRMPDMCIEALKLTKQRMPDIEIDVYGSDSHGNIPFRHNNLGLIQDLNKINEVYNECAVGLCLSATNPSRIPFEMMAAGCIPIDIYQYNNLFDYDEGCGLLAYPSPEALAEAMCLVLEDEAFRAKLSRNGLASVKNRTMSWETDVAVNAVEWCLTGNNFECFQQPKPTYTNDAIIGSDSTNKAMKKYTDWQWKLASQHI